MKGKINYTSPMDNAPQSASTFGTHRKTKKYVPPPLLAQVYLQMSSIGKTTVSPSVTRYIKLGHLGTTTHPHLPQMKPPPPVRTAKYTTNAKMNNKKREAKVSTMENI